VYSGFYKCGNLAPVLVDEFTRPHLPHFYLHLFLPIPKFYIYTLLVDDAGFWGVPYVGVRVLDGGERVGSDVGGDVGKNAGT
jgi:hypothetical protein